MTDTTLSSRIAARDKALIADALKIRYTPFALSHGDGARLFDVEGRSFIDFGAAWSAAGLGYSNQHVQKAIQRQLEKTTCGILISGMQEPALDLAERLIALAPGDFEKKVWYGLAGSDASEAAQRMILRATGKPRIISFIGSWHGTTDAGMALSAHPSLTGFAGGGHVTKIPYPNPYRDPFGGDGRNLTDRCLNYLENFLFTTICPPGEVA
ncbi:MAG: aminotransferase class III-fold pyridoxal phosphate-dependent enzyme, partial [Thermomicrobiales bacterium]